MNYSSEPKKLLEVNEMDIGKLVKRAALIGMGAADLTREKAEQLAKDLEKRGHMSSKESKKMVSELMRESKKQGVKLQKLVEKEVQKTLKKVGVATRSDIVKLRREMKGKKAKPRRK
jgi:polyhydroxyalkanoate synthesis regulator phasin